MNKKMFRRLSIVFVVLALFLASVPANADLTCEEICQIHYDDCVQYAQYCVAYCQGNPICLGHCDYMWQVCQSGYQYCMDECQ